MTDKKVEKAPLLAFEGSRLQEQIHSIRTVVQGIWEEVFTIGRSINAITETFKLIDKRLASLSNCQAVMIQALANLGAISIDTEKKQIKLVVKEVQKDVPK